jgi:predicted peptidase
MLSKLFLAVAGATAAVAQTYTESFYEVDQSLPGHTIYRPRDMSAFEKIPVLVWGNGACSSDSLSHVNFNLEVAAWGVVVIAQGTPGQQGSTTPDMMKAAIDWATTTAGSGTYANVDASRIAAAGMSCGGTEAYAMGECSTNSLLSSHRIAKLRAFV